MKITSYVETDDAEWSGFVASHSDRSTGHLWAMGELERLAAGAKNQSLIARDDAGRLIGVVPLFETERRELRVARSRILSSGNHLASGPLLSNSLGRRQQVQLTERLVERILDDARRLRVDAVHIAYPTIVKSRPAIETVGLYPLRPFGFHESNVVAIVADLTADEDALLASLDSKCRNQIKRCTSAGAEVRLLTSRDEWMRSYELNRATLGPAAYSSDVIRAIWDLFVAPKHAAVVGTFFEGRLISVVMVTLVGASSYYWFSFNETPLPVPGANSAALWQGMLTAKRAGAAIFELGSMEFDDPKQVRIGKFKAQFGGRPVYTLAGTRQLRPVRRAALDLAAQLFRAVRGSKRHRAPSSDVKTKGAPPSEV